MGPGAQKRIPPPAPLRDWTIIELTAGKEVPTSPYIGELWAKLGVFEQVELDGLAAWNILSAQQVAGSDEISGLFAMNDDEQLIVAIVSTNRGRWGSVTTDGQEYAALTEIMVEEKGLMPNGQWHTHPGFGASWSTTDTGDQERKVARSAGYAPQGYTHFLVIDPFETAIVRTVMWDKETMEVAYVDRPLVITYPDGRIELPMERPKRSHSYDYDLYDYGYYGYKGQSGLFTGDRVKLSVPTDDGKTRLAWLTVTEQYQGEEKFDWIGEEEDGFRWKFAESIVEERIPWYQKYDKRSASQEQDEPAVSNQLLPLSMAQPGDVITWNTRGGAEMAGTITSGPEMVSRRGELNALFIAEDENGARFQVWEDQITDIIFVNFLEEMEEEWPY